MKPLICFYENNTFIFSEQYELKTCGPTEKISDFLKHIELSNADDLKVVQINFEYENTDLFKNQKSLYASDKASVFILKQFDILTQSELLKRLASADLNLKFELIEKRSRFIEKVNYIKEQIAQGRIYQVNLTSALQSVNSPSAETLFSHYFSSFNGNYKALLPLQHSNVISFSPELFLSKKSNRLITQPIKGSISQERDFALNLLDDKKEEAELSMIVDLLRNDLNRIEPQQSALVTAHRKAIQLGYIQHTYSEISIHSEKSLAPIIDYTFPGGSISGCPKIESLKVLTEVEAIKRQAYTGSLGWWKNNEFCLNLTIRSFIQSSDSVFYHAGCGIVYDSQAEKEWDEFILKTGKINAE